MKDISQFDRLKALNEILDDTNKVEVDTSYLDTPEMKARYSDREISYMKYRDNCGYQDMTAREQWTFDANHNMLDF